MKTYKQHTKPCKIFKYLHMNTNKISLLSAQTYKILEESTGLSEFVGKTFQYYSIYNSRVLQSSFVYCIVYLFFFSELDPNPTRLISLEGLGCPAASKSGTYELASCDTPLPSACHPLPGKGYNNVNALKLYQNMSYEIES